MYMALECNLDCQFFQTTGPSFAVELMPHKIPKNMLKNDLKYIEGDVNNEQTEFNQSIFKKISLSVKNYDEFHLSRA